MRKEKLPKRGNAWLIRDKYGKMRRALFFHPRHAREYANYELMNLRTEIIEVKAIFFKIPIKTKTDKQ